MERLCPHCGESFLSFGHTRSAPRSCPICRKALDSGEMDSSPSSLRAEESNLGEEDPEITQKVRPEVPEKVFGTLFQPGLFFRTLLGGPSEPVPGPTGTASMPEQSSSAPGSAATIREAYFELGDTGQRVNLVSDRLVVGRSAGADLSLDDEAVSSEHFAIEVRGYEVFVRDLSSHNGTYLNGARVRYCELLPDDQIRAGATVLTFRVLGSRAG